MADDLDGDSLPDSGRIDALPDPDYLSRGLMSGRERFRFGELAVLVEVGAADSFGPDLDEGVTGAGLEAFDAFEFDCV